MEWQGKVWDLALSEHLLKHRRVVRCHTKPDRFDKVWFPIHLYVNKSDINVKPPATRTYLWTGYVIDR